MASRLTANERKKQIVEAAIELFSTQGLNGTTTRQIAEKAGITEALIYKHFTGKEDLYKAALEKLIHRMTAAPFYNMIFKGKSPIEAMKEGAKMNLKFMDEHPYFTKLLLYSGLQQHELAQPFFKSFALPILDKLEDFLNNGQILGKVRDDIDPALSGMPLLGAVVFFNLARNVFQVEKFKSIEPEEYVENLMKLYLRGFSAAEGTNDKDN